MSALTIKLGCDPEVFLIRDGKAVSAHNVIPGTKEIPFKVHKGAIQVDGLAAEFNTDPALDQETFSNNIETVLNQLKERAGMPISIEPVAIFEEKYFESLPDNAKELGCNPDYNAWTGLVNPAPCNKDFPTMRTASGHIHIGWTEGKDPKDAAHFEDCCTIVKQLDYYLGMPSLLWDKDNRRRSLYGKAGAFRPKPYGVEYRVLSNVWIKSPEMRKWIFNTTLMAIRHLMDRGYYAPDNWGDTARKIIDDNVDWFGNQKWFEDNNLPVTLSDILNNHFGINRPPINTLSQDNISKVQFSL